MTLASARLAATLWWAAALAGCVDMAPVRDGARVLSTTAAQRMTDEAVRRDWAAIEALRVRIAAARAHAPRAYAVARAEAQLEFALDEYEENDRTGLVERLLDDALRLVRSQEPGYSGPADLALPSLPAMTPRRDDLWQQATQAKGDPRVLQCAGEAIARLEVALLEYGHEQYEADLGLNAPDHAQPHAALVDSLARDLARAAAACTAPPRAAAASTVPAAPVSRAAPAPEATTPTFPDRLWVSTLFRFDESDEPHMLPEGRAELDRFARALVVHRDLWRRLVVSGHTDRLGGHARNLRLSLRRAETVRSVLVLRHGLPAEHIEVQGLAATQPLAYCTGAVNDALRACLQPNRRVQIEVLQ